MLRLCHSYVFAGSVLLTQAHEANQEHFLAFTDLNQRRTNGRVAKLVKLSHEISPLVISDIYDLVTLLVICFLPCPVHVLFNPFTRQVPFLFRQSDMNSLFFFFFFNVTRVHREVHTRGAKVGALD